jgi:hypothetical protein
VLNLPLTLLKFLEKRPLSLKVLRGVAALRPASENLRFDFTLIPPVKIQPAFAAVRPDWAHCIPAKYRNRFTLVASPPLTAALSFTVDPCWFGGVNSPFQVPVARAASARSDAPDVS